MRWALTLQPYRFRIEAIKGKDKVGADYLSRIYLYIDQRNFSICLVTVSSVHIIHTFQRGKIVSQRIF